MGGRMSSDNDARTYLEGYPGQEDDLSINDNIKFYRNQLRSRPDGLLVEEFHLQWAGNYFNLEANHGFIQWLFPIREHGMNFESVPLQKHEIDLFLQDPNCGQRLVKSYQLMLDFYGMRIKTLETGELERSERYLERYQHLNTSFHNYLRITRILKCLGELGYEHYKSPFLDFVLNEMMEGHLWSCTTSFKDYWAPVLRNEQERDMFQQKLESVLEKKRAQKASQSAHFQKTPKASDMKRKVEGEAEKEEVEKEEVEKEEVEKEEV
eukprot:Lithocolla_globosa_v1_NODE_5385_length_1249_cov_15.352596.p1 type:complete len:266 gc:universal NODE_5385_length_1249_cov_15.352596:891-94(-)